MVNNKNSIAIHFCDLQKSANSQSEQKNRWKVPKLSLRRIRVDRWYKKFNKSYDFKLFSRAFAELLKIFTKVCEQCELSGWVYTAKSCDHFDSRNSKKFSWIDEETWKTQKPAPLTIHKREDFLSITNTDGRPGSTKRRSSLLHAPLGEQKTSTVERKWIISSLVAVQVLFFSVPCCRFVCGLACLSVLFACWTRPAGSFCSNTFALEMEKKRSKPNEPQNVSFSLEESLIVFGRGIIESPESLACLTKFELISSPHRAVYVQLDARRQEEAGK